MMSLTGSLSGGGGVFASSDLHTFDSGGYRYHEFTSSGTLAVTSGGTFDVLLVGGGGGGGSSNAGGGGGGEVIIGTGLTLPSGANTITVTVGAGGAGGTNANTLGTNGSASSIVATSGLTTISARPGGVGKSRFTQVAPVTGVSNSGGGSDGEHLVDRPAGAAETGVSASSYTTENGGSYSIYGGNIGGDGSGWHSTNRAYDGGAGGAGAGFVNTGDDGDGGPGVQVTGWGSNNYYYGGGGGSSNYQKNGGAGGIGGGGGGGGGGSGGGSARTSGGSGGGAGGANTGGGGGGGYLNATGGSGGSGIVVIRYAI
jgi:hypothetical protein